MAVEQKFVTQVVNQGSLYEQGCLVEPLTANTLSVSAGQVRDSTNTFDMALSQDSILDLSVSGVNGLQPTETFSNDTWYAIFIMGSKLDALQVATIAVTSTSPNEIPFPKDLPLSSDQTYNIFRFIGWVRSGSSGLLQYTMIPGGVGKRKVYWNDLTATAVSFTSATYAFMTGSFGSLVPPTTLEFEAQGVLLNLAGVTPFTAAISQRVTDPGPTSAYIFQFDSPVAVGGGIGRTFLSMAIGRDGSGNAGIGGRIIAGDGGGNSLQIQVSSFTFSI